VKGDIARKIFIVLLMLSMVSACKEEKQAGTEGGDAVKLEIRSSAFENGGDIPSRYTCDGEDISPPLSWSGGKEGTKSFTLISDDPDAPAGTWVHWVIFNMPPGTRELKEDMPADKVLANGARQGINDSRRIGYSGPCPPGGTHRYYFKLYALDTMLELAHGATKKQLLKAMQNHILAEAQLMGKYARK